MKILYLTYVDFLKQSGGSSMRPYRIYEALLSLENEVCCVMTPQLRNKKKERLKELRIIEEKIKNGEFDFCYIELPTTPITFYKDLNIFRLLKKYKVKTAAFYRDAYWKFDTVQNEKGLKRLYHLLGYKRDLVFLEKYCNILYFPTKPLMNLFDSYNFKNRDTLPPGISPQVCKHTTIFNNCIYVGGISNELYAPEIFIEAVKSINESGKLKLTFTLVCREKELSDSYGIKKYLDEEWLNVVHTSDQNVLRDLYAKADFGISALKKTPYAHLCMPIKLGEYLSNGLPLITTDCVAIKEFVDDNKCGILCSDNGYSAKQAILEFYTKEEERLELYKNVEKTVLKNGWVSRVEKILNDLSKVK